MLSEQVSDIKLFMTQLLKDTMFDNFQLCEATIQTGCSYTIDGHLNLVFYNSDELEILDQRTYALWSEVKPLAFDMIKGTHTPLSFKIVMMLAPSNVSKLVTQNNLPIHPEDISGLYLNILYDRSTLTLTSGVALKVFTLDKSIEHIWDENLRKYCSKCNITFLS